jgi:hypothetical protein
MTDAAQSDAPKMTAPRLTMTKQQVDALFAGAPPPEGQKFSVILTAGPVIESGSQDFTFEPPESMDDPASGEPDGDESGFPEGMGSEEEQKALGYDRRKLATSRRTAAAGIPPVKGLDLD